jgi:conjugal transfer pilus assembly protein TrbC
MKYLILFLLLPFLSFAEDFSKEELSKATDKFKKESSIQLNKVDKSFYQINKDKQLPIYDFNINKDTKLDIDGISKQSANLFKKGNSVEKDPDYPDLMLFVSMSMPQESLTEYAKQAKDIGAVLIFRGLDGGKISTMQKSVSEWDKSKTELLIHPALYKAYKINKVPAFVMAREFGVNTDKNIIVDEKDYVKIEGDISIDQSLTFINLLVKDKHFSNRAQGLLKKIRY